MRGHINRVVSSINNDAARATLTQEINDSYIPAILSSCVRLSRGGSAAHEHDGASGRTGGGSRHAGGAAVSPGNPRANAWK